MQYDYNSLTCSVTTNRKCIKVHEIICKLNRYVQIKKKYNQTQQLQTLNTAITHSQHLQF